MWTGTPPTLRTSNGIRLLLRLLHQLQGALQGARSQDLRGQVHDKEGVAPDLLRKLLELVHAVLDDLATLLAPGLRVVVGECEERSHLLLASLEVGGVEAVHDLRLDDHLGRGELGDAAPVLELGPDETLEGLLKGRLSQGRAVLEELDPALAGAVDLDHGLSPG